MKTFILAAVALAAVCTPALAKDSVYKRAYVNCVKIYAPKADWDTVNNVCEGPLFLDWARQKNFKREYAELKQKDDYMRGYIRGRVETFGEEMGGVPDTQ